MLFTEPIEHRQHDRPPHCQRLIRRAGNNDSRRLPDPSHCSRAPGLQRETMRDHLAALGQRDDASIRAADPAAADNDKQIAIAAIELIANRRRIARRGFDRHDMRTGLT